MAISHNTRATVAVVLALLDGLDQRWSFVLKMVCCTLLLVSYPEMTNSLISLLLRE